MKRVIFGLIIALLTFIVGIGVAMLWIKQNAASPYIAPISVSSVEMPQPYIPDDAIYSITFCDLAHNPSRYDRKIIRMRVFLEIAHDGANFYDRPECTEDDIWIYPTFFLIGSDKKVNAFWQKLEHLSSLGKLDVVGRFYANQDKFGNRLDLIEAKSGESNIKKRK